MSSELKPTQAGGRVAWVDVCKAIAMVLVIALHYGVPSGVDHYVHYFHMPVFFFLSGLLSDVGSWGPDTLARKARSLLVPYLVFGSTSFAFWSVVSLVAYGRSEPPLGDFLECFLLRCTSPLASLWGGVQWFLPALLLAQVLGWAVIMLPRVAWPVAAAGCLATAVALGPDPAGAVPWAVLPALSMVPVFLLGYRARAISGAAERLRTSRQVALAAAGMLATGCCLALNGPVNVRAASFGNPALFLAGAGGGVAVLCLLSMVIERLLSGRPRQWVLEFGANTIVVLFFHRWLQGVVLTALGAWGMGPEGTAQAVALRACLLSACLALSGPVIRLVNKHAPWAVGRVLSPVLPGR